VGPASYRDWLGALTDADTLSLYFHVPFCQEMCWFCGCHTKVTRRYDPVAKYVGHLAKEVDLVADAIYARPKVTAAHWGGGSPTKLSADDFRRLMARARERFDFAPDADIAVEIDPRTLTPAFVEAMAEMGVTRASLGLQDLNPHVQEAINRVQPFAMVEEAVTALRAAGITAINFDLIYGLPHQTLADIDRSVDLAASLRPDRLSVFGYAHVPWMKTHQKMIPDEALPDTEERYAQCEALGERLVAKGYRRIGLDHFALPDDDMTRALDAGTLRRNFQGYTVDEASALIGLGASSIGKLPQGYVQNHVPMKAYGDAVEANALATARGVALTEDDRVRGRIIEKLMCDLAVDLSAFGGAEEWQEELRAIEPLQRDGIARVSGSRIEVTDLGRPFMRLVCAAFDAYLKPQPARYSKAI
jgi:oxygen-independent coproporphyrinogen-3 oxidase